MFRRILASLAVVAVLSTPPWAGTMMLMGAGPQTPAAWNPLNLPGLVGWYKGDAGTFTNTGCTTPAVNGNTLGCWADQSGHSANLIQATTGQQPRYDTSSLNGLSVVTAPAGASQMSVAIFNLGGTTASVFMVVKSTAANLGRVVDYGVGSTDTSSTSFIAAFFSSITAPASYNNGFKSQGTVVSSSWNEIGSIFDGTNNTMYIGGIAQTPVGATSTFATNGNLNSFSDPVGAFPLTGSIAEIIVTSGALGTADRASIKTYLLARWGV